MNKAAILAWGFAGIGAIDLVWIDASLLPRVVEQHHAHDVVSASVMGASSGTAWVPASTSTTPTTPATSTPIPVVVDAPRIADAPVVVDEAAIEPSAPVTAAVASPLPRVAVRFEDVGGTEVSPAVGSELDAVVERMQREAKLRVVVEGHADARGSRRVNLGLSKRRAQAVADALVARGAEPGRIQVRWFGERKPAVAGAGDAAWAANRRAEIEWRRK